MDNIKAEFVSVVCEQITDTEKIRKIIEAFDKATIQYSKKDVGMLLNNGA